VLHAYLRHAYVDRGVWLIRNYYNLQTRSFATNSYLVDYDPDTLAEAARELHDAELADGARRSYAVVARAVSAAGLLYDAIAPELETIYPLRPDVIFFSPNAITQIANTCAVARTVAVGKPDIARRVLAIGVKHARTLKVAYNVQTGAAIDPRSAGTPALACFARLADDLHDVAARRALDGAFTDNARTQLAHGPLGPELAVDVDLALRRLTDAVR
jgi:hypothetical protein